MTLKELKDSRLVWRTREVSRLAKYKFYRDVSRRPKAEKAALAKKWRALWVEAKDKRVRRDTQIAKLDDGNDWGGCRAITNEIIAIVGDRASVTSRKRAANHPLSRANPGSHHNAANKNSDAVDFGIAEAHWLKNYVSKRLGGPSVVQDYGWFTVRRNNKTFRVQAIAGTHGTGPHLHFGVERV